MAMPMAESLKIKVDSLPDMVSMGRYFRIVLESAQYSSIEHKVKENPSRSPRILENVGGFTSWHSYDGTWAKLSFFRSPPAQDLSNKKNPSSLA